MMVTTVTSNPEIPAYLRFIPAALLEKLDAEAVPVPSIEGLRVAAGLREAFPIIETDDALRFVVSPL